MKLETLSATHATYDAATWARYSALYRGGRAFREQIGNFLPKNPKEPSEVYKARQVQAPYRCYAGPIVDFFAAQLFSAPVVIRGARGDQDAHGAEKRDADLHPFYARFREDCDGAGIDLVDFWRGRFTTALVEGAAWALVELPDPTEDEGGDPRNALEYEERKLGDATLSPLENEQVLDWEYDRRGRLLWAIARTVEIPREDPRSRRGVIRVTWRVYDPESVETFQIEYEPSRPPRPEDHIPSVGKRSHRFSRTPLVRLGFVGSRGIKLNGKTIGPAAVEGLWLLNRVADAQTEHFQLSAALSWNLKRTCYSMPVFKLVNRKDMPVMGAGYGIIIGEKESVEWAAPPVAHLAVMADEVKAQKDEVYRVANQMAQGIDNNAAAIGRSGESKQQDAENTEVCLKVYGALAREAIEQTYQLIADGRSDDVEFSIEGLDTFSLADATLAVDNATKASLLGVPSRTFRKELLKKTAAALLPNVPQGTKNAINQEIDEGVEAEAELADIAIEENENEVGEPPAGRTVAGAPPRVRPDRMQPPA